jgi:hypothetical protein
MKKLNTKSAQVRYYRAQGAALMNSIEDTTKKLINDIDAQLEAQYWRAHDSQSVPELRKVYKKLCELHDLLTMD